jgi:hypothetical protein
MPDPVVSDGAYKSFEELYGTETDDGDRPSRQFTPQATDRDKKFRSVLVSGTSFILQIILKICIQFM